MNIQQMLKLGFLAALIFLCVAPAAKASNIHRDYMEKRYMEILDIAGLHKKPWQKESVKLLQKIVNKAGWNEKCIPPSLYRSYFTLLWEEVFPTYYDAYREVLLGGYTDAELKQLSDFYKSPAGQGVIEYRRARAQEKKELTGKEVSIAKKHLKDANDFFRTEAGQKEGALFKSNYVQTVVAIAEGRLESKKEDIGMKGVDLIMEYRTQFEECSHSASPAPFQ